MREAVSLIITAILSYILGSLNFAIIISRLIKHDDIRSHGSGNAGITNYARTFGGKSTILVVIGDMGKCLLAVYISRWLAGDLAKFLAGLFVMCGHAFPVFFGFKGGKGVLTTAALILAFDLRAFLIGISIFAVIVLITRYVSLGSLIAVWSVLPMIWIYYGDVERAWWCILVYALTALFITVLHKENINRLIHGSESKFVFKRKNRIE